MRYFVKIINMCVCLVSFKLVTYGYNVLGLILFLNPYTESSNFRVFGRKHWLQA